MNRLMGVLWWRIDTGLVGGRAPGVWRRAVARSAARLSILERAGAWVKTFITVRPKLIGGPLFGHNLGRLVNQTQPPPEAPAEAPRLRPTQPARPKHRWNRAGEVSPAVSPGVAPKRDTRATHRTAVEQVSPVAGRASAVRLDPVKLERRVNQALLRQLAGDAVPDVGSTAVRHRSLAGIPAQRKRTMLAVLNDLKRQRDWLNELAQRAARLLRMDGFEVSCVGSGVSSDPSQFDQWSSLAAQWDLPINLPPKATDLPRSATGRHSGDAADSAPGARMRSAQADVMEGRFAPSKLLARLASLPLSGVSGQGERAARPWQVDGPARASEMPAFPATVQDGNGRAGVLAESSAERVTVHTEPEGTYQPLQIGRVASVEPGGKSNLGRDVSDRWTNKPDAMA
jgi:hypothetical protein